MSTRKENIALLEETLRICKRADGAPDRMPVPLKLSREAMEKAIVLLPGDVREICASPELAEVLARPAEGACGCANEDSLRAARRQLGRYARLFEDGKPPLVLNFANAVSPGGGVWTGVTAQEQDLCRKSSLLLSLESADAAPFYEYNRRMAGDMASDAMVFSPEVEVLRDDDGGFLAETAVVAVLTCAAPMLHRGGPEMDASAYRRLLYGRITAMLKCAVRFGYRACVLGAWGCGAFRNDPAIVSDLFFQALRDGIRPDGSPFDRVDFAVLDRSPDQHVYKEFHRNFADGLFHAGNPSEERPDGLSG